MIIWVFLLTGRKSVDTGKYNLTYAYTNSSLTYKSNDDIVHTVVLQKLAMSVAGGVPCVGSTFYFPNNTYRSCQ